MYLKTPVKIPDIKTGISEKKIKGTTYIYYEYGRKYYPDRKYTVPQCTSIGKVDADDPSMMFPNDNFLKYFPDIGLPEELPASSRSGCIKIGAWLVIRKVIQQYKLEEKLSGIIGENSGLFLDLVAYAIITENNVAQYYPDYAYNHPLFTREMKVYSDLKISSFLREISRDDSIEFQNEWNAKRDHREKIYISYDSTNKHCQAGDVEIAEFGHEKDKQSKPVFNYSIGYDRSNRIPLFYEVYPGSINDMSQLQCMLNKAKSFGYKNAGFFLDRGYFSEPNIRFMDRNGYSYIIMVKGCKELASQAIVENRGTFEDEWEKAIPYHDVSGTTVKRPIFKKDVEERCFHLYYSDFRKAKERTKLNHQIQEQKEFLEGLKGTETEIDKSFSPYFDLIYYEKEGKKILQVVREREDVISDAIKLCGYFCIITSSEMTAAEALDLYKSRDCSEKLFRADKSYLGERTLRTYQDEPTHSKMFIEFVALIIRNKIYTLLKDRMKELKKKKNYMSVPAAIRELEKIELIRQADKVYRLDHAITATQKDILQAFNMTAVNVMKEAEKLGQCLSSLTN
jgi:transposase